MIVAASQKTRHIRATFENEIDFVLLRVAGRCALSELFKLELTLLHADTSQPVDPASVIGLGVGVEIEMPNEDQPRQYFGCIRELKQVGWDDSGITYLATMVPTLWFLTQRNNCRIFQNENTPSIVEAVLKNAGINDFEFELSKSYSKREYCVQYRETDFNFVSRLLEEEGIFYYFRHESDRNVIVFCDAPSHYYDLEIDTVHFPKSGLELIHRPEIQNWHEKFQFVPGTVTQKDFNFKDPYSKSLLQRKSSLVNLPNNRACEFYDYHGRYADETTGRHLTEVRMGEIEKDYQTGIAMSNLAVIHPGGKFKFGTHRMKSRVGKQYAVTAVDFEARAGEYSTKNPNAEDSEEDDWHFVNEFTCIPSDRAFRPTRRAERPFVQGPQTAIVTTNGDEIMVDEHGRVKVHFHWDRYNEFNDTSSCWIRVSQVHAGQGFGMMDIPRKNEEVIVSFIEGDPDRPIITGRVYNGANRPPFDLAGGSNGENKTRRGNTTKSVDADTTSFNEMSMDDTPGKEQIRVNAQYNMDSNVNNNETLNVGVDRQASVGNNETLGVGANRTAKIGSNDSKTIGANKALDVAENNSISVGLNQSVQIGITQNELIGLMANQLVGGAKTVTVGGALNTAVGYSNTQQVGFKKNTSVGGTYSINVGKKFEIVCGGSKLTMDSGGTVKIEASSEIQLVGGGATILMKGGVIDLN